MAVPYDKRFPIEFDELFNGTHAKPDSATSADARTAAAQGR